MEHTVEIGAVSVQDAVGQASPVLASGTLQLNIPAQATSVTVRADQVASATVARYGFTALSVGAQSANDGSRLFSLALDISIPCKGLSQLYFAVDAGTANWQFAFVLAPTLP